MQGELMNYSGGSEVVTQLQWYERTKDDLMLFFLF